MKVKLPRAFESRIPALENEAFKVRITGQANCRNVEFQNNKNSCTVSLGKGASVISIIKMKRKNFVMGWVGKGGFRLKKILNEPKLEARNIDSVFFSL